MNEEAEWIDIRLGRRGNSEDDNQVPSLGS